MRTLKFLLQKEFRQIFRNPSIIRIIFVMPVIQLLILPWAADYEIKNIKISIIDHDHSSYSQKLIAKITASNYFQLANYSHSYKESLHTVEQANADIILEIPADFEKTLVTENEAPVFMAVNAINGVKAGLGSAYLQTIIRDYNTDVRMQWIQLPRFSPELQIEVVTANWFNPLMNYKFFMVPGILVILLTMVGASLSSLNIVKEKEIGTIEQINVTPVKKYHFILGKLIPFWIIGLIILSIGLTIAWLAYGIVPVGSLFVIYAFAAIYLLVVLGLGLLISTYTNNQQQAMLISFFMLMVFILLGGLYTSIDSMPDWARMVTKLNPVAYFVEVIRMVVLKGSGFSDIWRQVLIMLGFAVILNSWAIYNYKKKVVGRIFVYSVTKNCARMIKFNELQPGDRVFAEYEGQKWEGTVKELNREEKEVCVETEVQDFWFTPEHLFPIPLSDDQLIKLGFNKLPNDKGVKYLKDAFRLQIPRENDFNALEIWYREDRRELKQPIAVHELQNHYYQMTKVELNPA